MRGHTEHTLPPAVKVPMYNVSAQGKLLVTLWPAFSLGAGHVGQTPDSQKENRCWHKPQFAVWEQWATLTSGEQWETLLKSNEGPPTLQAGPSNDGHCRLAMLSLPCILTNDIFNSASLHPLPEWRLLRYTNAGISNYLQIILFLGFSTIVRQSQSWYTLWLKRPWRFVHVLSVQNMFSPKVIIDYILLN